MPATDRARSPSLTVALLMYNEEGTIGAVLEETVVFLTGALDDWEILVVDDGGDDGGADIVRRFSETDGRVRLLVHSRNKGMGAGIATGIRNATKEWFTFNAADGQIAPRELGKMLACLDKAPIVLTNYEGGRGSLRRGALSAAFRAFLRVFAGISFDMEGLYLCPTLAAKRIEPRIRARTFFFSFELIERAIEEGIPFTATSISLSPRSRGRSKVANFGRIARVAAEVVGYGARKRLER
jgi:glycosyltransferase involved in cell wall biosynthesis